MVSENEETRQQEGQRQRRLEAFQPREARAARGSGGDVIRASKNTKVTVLAERIIERFLERGVAELEAVGAAALSTRR